MSTYNTSPSRGFTCLELVVTILIIGFLVSCIVPLLEKSHYNRWQERSRKRFEQVALAIGAYAEVYGAYPPAWTEDAEGHPLHSWRVLILPHFTDIPNFPPFADDAKALYEKIRLDEPWDSEWNRPFSEQFVTPYRLGWGRAKRHVQSADESQTVLLVDRAKSTCDLSVVVGEGTLFPGAESAPFDPSADESQTVLLVCRAKTNCWMDPTVEIDLATALTGFQAEDGLDASFRESGWWSQKKVTKVAMADGTVREIPPSIDPDLWKKMLLRRRTGLSNTNISKLNEGGP